MPIPFYQIDAFTTQVFKGNPAGVCPLDKWLPDTTLQAIAAENNLSETAFFIPGNNTYHLRWFTPVAEVDLCGHATLATAWVIFNELNYPDDEIVFQSRSGILKVSRQMEFLELDFPSRPPVPCQPPDDLLAGLVEPPDEVLAAEDYLAVYSTNKQVRMLAPLMEYLAQFPRGVIATAPGEDCDFVSRFFVPALGIPEDPVTGSAHCVLTPYWAQRLKKNKLVARQISARGGELYCTNKKERTLIAGRAVKFMEGTILI